MIASQPEEAVVKNLVTLSDFLLKPQKTMTRSLRTCLFFPQYLAVFRILTHYHVSLTKEWLNSLCRSA